MGSQSEYRETDSHGIGTTVAPARGDRGKSWGGGVVKMGSLGHADHYLGGRMDKIQWHTRNGSHEDFSVWKTKRYQDEAEMRIF